MASKHQLTSADNEKTAKMPRLYALTDTFKNKTNKYKMYKEN